MTHKIRFTHELPTIARQPGPIQTESFNTFFNRPSMYCLQCGRKMSHYLDGVICQICLSDPYRRVTGTRIA